MKNLLIFGILLLAFTSCTSDEIRVKRKLRQKNQTATIISRRADDPATITPPPEPAILPSYPWTETGSGSYYTITKEFFRCKGKQLNPARMKEDSNGKAIRLVDCQGGLKHSLPLRDKKEFIYPVLIDLLNYIQDKTGNRVVITCGHRCPTHNTYADDSKYNNTSKHMIAAEVDFYVQGMENTPDQILTIIFDYYKKRYPNDSSLAEFSRYTKPDTNASTPPWYNKEVFIKLFQSHEERDLDNRHPYPYIGIQVRWDRDLQKRVAYTWPHAHRGYLRE